MNPLAQGWNNANASTQPTYGVLPGPGYSQPATTLANPPELVRFVFTPSGPDGTIHNSVVTRISAGPTEPVFRITTNSTTHGYSVVQSGAYEKCAYVEWLAQATPMVEVYGIVSKRTTAAWLALSSRKSYRRMSARHYTFRWVPDESNINLSSDSASNPRFYGRISRAHGVTAVELTPEALQLGLLEVAVVAALVILSGRNID
ncbi:hypothetical protein MIND_00883900 [Mycena indigotica]|uniref:Uncharacterized protein n=1 Tax=Mycena indigotica TaxID=2126181 RepID=A0A8H6SIA6_9AGAR|nr:uncharacterized protein MIND_00883900 [Mycena indigotica]KAF7299347.1 hypothetical protein MIND_00883900 [Mycena indigotica]